MVVRHWRRERTISMVKRQREVDGSLKIVMDRSGRMRIAHTHVYAHDEYPARRVLNNNRRYVFLDCLLEPYPLGTFRVYAWTRWRKLMPDDDDENDKVPAASVRELPSPELEGLWEKYVGILSGVW